MKIYALTEITELPKECRLCPYLKYFRDKAICSKKTHKGELLTVFWRRPNWCPLRTEQEIKESE